LAVLLDDGPDKKAADANFLSATSTTTTVTLA